MVFKLVQIDSENPYKVELELGTHVFGRCKILNVNDRRISRQHGQFEVTDDSLIITALHQNPCFYKKSDTTQPETLRQNNSVNLNNGDKLGLLPTSYWYEVLHCTPLSEESSTEKKSHKNATLEVLVDSGEETDNEVESMAGLASNQNEVSENDNLESQSTQVLLPLSSPDLDERSEPRGKESEKGTSPTKKTPITEKISPELRQSTDCDSDKTHIDVHPHTSPSLLFEQGQEEQSNEEASSEQNALQKRPHSDTEENSSEVVKKIKQDPEESEDKPVIKTEAEGQAGSSANNVGVVNNTQAAPALASVGRERCMYGASCYRRNPAHRAQFSHPSDADWGVGAKAPCPYGAACAKRDPRHWRDHDHPPGKDQPPPQAGVQVVHRQGNVFYINAHSVNFYDDHFAAEDSDGNSVDYDYEF